MLLKLEAGAFLIISTESIETIQRGDDVVFGRQSQPLQLGFPEGDTRTAGFAVVAESETFLAPDESL